MFKKSKNTEPDLFKNIIGQVSDRKRSMLESESGWHNVFYKEVIGKLDESLFSVLFDESNGRPNASIRILVGMMILKEGKGWSDEQLFESCRFNLKVMMALGLTNIDEDVPVESTYYEFRRALSNYISYNDRDLLKESLRKVTLYQIVSHGVSGEKIRMDSKLINSNIAVSSRVEMILEAVRKFVKPLDLSGKKKRLKSETYTFLEQLKESSTTNITYPLTTGQKERLLVKLGTVIQRLLMYYPGKPNYALLKQIYEEQYEERNDKDTHDNSLPEPKEGKDLSSSNIQSIHDPQAKYRSKGRGTSKQRIKGYHANVTETCVPDNPLNLIVDVEVSDANINENEFLIPSIKASEDLLQESKGQTEQTEDNIIKQVTCDGGFDSLENREEMSKENMPEYNLSNAKGGNGKYILSYNEKKELEAYDKASNKKLEVRYSEKKKKHVIVTGKKTNRYLTEQEVQNYMLRQKILSKKNEEDKNLRANVESTIHQVFHKLKKRNKMVYRGLAKCKLFVTSLVFWTNFRRIAIKIA